MLHLIKVSRFIFGAIALWQFLTILSGLVLNMAYFDTSMDLGKAGWQTGRLIASISIKLFIMLVAYGFYLLLGRAKSNYENKFAKDQNTKNVEIVAKISSEKKSLKISAAIAMLIIFLSVLGLAAYFTSYFSFAALGNKPNHSIAGCTTMLTAIRERFPNAKNYTSIELAELLLVDPSSNQAQEEKNKIQVMLNDCSWTRVSQGDQENIYISKNSVRILPANRRSAAFLHDFSRPKEFRQGNIVKNYGSMLQGIVTDCTNGGVAILSRRLMSHWFNSGEIVSEESVDIDPSVVALSLTENGTQEKMISNVVCGL